LRNECNEHEVTSSAGVSDWNMSRLATREIARRNVPSSLGRFDTPQCQAVRVKRASAAPVESTERGSSFGVQDHINPPSRGPYFAREPDVQSRPSQFSSPSVLSTQEEPCVPALMFSICLCTATPSFRLRFHISARRRFARRVEIAAELRSGGHAVFNRGLEPADPVVPPTTRLLVRA